MNQPLTDIVWKSRGISVLWDVASLAQLGPLAEALSLRDFFLWQADGFRKDSPHARMSSNSPRVVVAGLEATLDAMEPEDAELWMSDHFRPAAIQCAATLFNGGDAGALIFWMVRQERFRCRLHDGAILWTCDGEFRGREILFSHGMWNGAYRDVQRIVPPGSSDTGIGFYLQRIS